MSEEIVYFGIWFGSDQALNNIAYYSSLVSIAYISYTCYKKFWSGIFVLKLKAIIQSINDILIYE